MGKILLPSAVHPEERLTVSQSVPEPGASSQSDRNTQFGFFVSGRCGPKQWGDRSPEIKQWASGKAPDRRLFHRLFGRRFEPRSGEYGAAAAKRRPTRIRIADRKLCVGCVTIRPAVV